LPGRPVLSQRFVRAIKPLALPDTAKQLTFVVLGNTDSARTFFAAHGLRTSEIPAELLPDKHAVIVWNAPHLTESERRSASALCGFAARGGRVVVLSTPSWNWPELCKVTIGESRRFSRVYPHQPVAHSLLSGIDPQWLTRWNGFPGTVGIPPLEGPAMADAEKILWAKEPKSTVAARVPAAEGEGRLLFVQLDLQRRLDPLKTYYDPAAERLLLNLLAGGTQR